MFRLAWCLAVALVVPASSQAEDGGGILRDYTISSWTDKDGINGRIFAIAQTPDEFLWLGTDSGVIRFDGVRFVPWREISDRPLAARRVLTMCVGRDGSLWVGFTSPGGISRIRNGTAVNYGESSGLTGDPVESLVNDRDGSILASTRAGLFRFSNEKWEPVPIVGLPEGPVSNTFPDSQGNLWVSTTQGVFRRLRDQTTFRQMMPASYWSHRVMEDRNSAIWITVPRVGAVRFLDRPDADPPEVGGVKNRPGSADPDGEDSLGVQILADSRGDLWIATLGRGLWRLRSGGADNIMDVLTVDQGLRSNAVRALWEDHKKNIWVGTNAGLHQFSKKTITALTGVGVVRGLDNGTDGSIWIKTTSGLVQHKDGHVVRYGPPDLPSAFVSALHVDGNGTVWVVTTGGVTRLKDGRFSPLEIPFAQLTRVYSATTDAQGALWLCDRNHGLFRWANGTLTPFDVQGEIDHRTVTWVGNDAAGQVWITAAGELRRIEPDGTIRGVDWGKGVMGIYQETPGGPLWWYGVSGAGRVEGERVSIIGKNNGLPATPVFAVVPAPDGHVWLSTPVGLLRLSEDAFRQVENDAAAQIAYTLYDTEDGMAGLPLGSSAALDRDGRLWFTTVNGIGILDPNMTPAESLAPPVHILGLRADAQRMDLDSQLRLRPNTSTIELDYSAVTFSSPAKVRYRYRLEGFDRDWQDAGTRREALYTNLPPGNYTFHVSAATSEQGFGSDGAVIAFTLLPAFYQTWWFYGLCASALALMAWSAWQMRVRHLHREFQLVLGERARVGREIHDTLLQSLAGLALQLDVLANAAPAGAMKDTLAATRRDVEEYVRETRESINKLRSPKLDRGDLAAALRQTGERATSGTPVRFTLTTTGQAEKCESDTEQQLLRIGEQAVLNSVRHANASQVHLTLHYADDAIRMRVSDNGCGFSSEAVMAEQGEHHGLVGMQERAAEAGGQLSIITHPGGGTAVEVVIPRPSKK